VNEVPPPHEPDDADRLYHRASAQDDSRPSEMVRRRVLKHAAQLATERAAQKSAAGAGPVRAANRRWQRPAIFGTLAAATLAGLLVTPRFFTPVAPPMANQPATAALPPTATSASAGQSPPRAAQVPPMPAAAAEYAANNRPVTTQITGGARAKPAASANAAASAKVAASADRASDAQRDPDVAATASTLAGAAPPPSAASSAAAPRSLDPAAELRRAAQTGDIAQLQMLVAKQPPDARDADGRTALMLAVLRGQSHAVDVLLANGADPNAADAHGTTPLQAAVAGHQPNIAAALERAGAR
jgi:Ankyrin repeats (3 copies)